MTPKEKNELIHTILDHESLRPLSRIGRILRDPVRAIPYSVLALLSHIHPFSLTFNMLWGDKMTAYLPEGNTFYYYGYCEANLTNFMLRFIKPDMCVYDVGAHVGFYSMLLARLTEESGSVHSFEPTKWTFELLSKNTAPHQNVHRNNLACGDKKTTLTFSDYGPGYGAYNTLSSGGAPALHATPQTYTVDCIPLDEYSAKTRTSPDFIKLDAEGFESSILKGMQNILSEIRPLITLEIAGGDAWKENTDASLQIFAGANYVPFQVHVDGTLTKLKTVAGSDYDNIVMVPEEKLHMIKELII